MRRSVRLPPDRRPNGGRPTLRARQLLFALQLRGHAITVEADPPSLVIRPGPPVEEQPIVEALAYELRDALLEPIS